MTTETIVLTAGLIFLFLAILGGNIKGKETHIPLMGAATRIGLGIFGFVLCLPFAFSKLPASGVPTGTIVAWSFKNGQIPQGWAICNGSNGTPDLDGKFLMGVSSSDKIGQTGGRADIPVDGEHSHSGMTNGLAGTMFDQIFWDRGRGHIDEFHPKEKIMPDGKHNHGGENRPPFYTVLYIMKL